MYYETFMHHSIVPSLRLFSALILLRNLLIYYCLYNISLAFKLWLDSHNQKAYELLWISVS